ncbi:MAG: TIGR02452 family protein [Gemmatimonadales bacterium]
MSPLITLPSIDSDDMAAEHRRELDIDRNTARILGTSAVDAIQRGYYTTESGKRVDWRDAIETARRLKRSIPPDHEIPVSSRGQHSETRVQVTNQTTLGAARRLMAEGHKPLALNFANGIHPGGGFLNGARAQEESLCRSSGLFATLLGDPMYEAHMRRPEPDSTDWAILSPRVPVFRTDGGVSLESLWLLDFITSAAPVATRIGQPRSADLLRKRIHRVFEIARAYEYDTLLLGAWGCGAFGNDTQQTAIDFRNLLSGEFSGTFANVTFAITDWSRDRLFLGPFRDVFEKQ